MTRLNNVVVAGGVSANKQLRAFRLTQEVERRRGKIFFPPMRLCTDNGAMIAAAGIARMESMTEAERKALIEKISFGVRPRWPSGNAAQGSAAGAPHGLEHAAEPLCQKERG